MRFKNDVRVLSQGGKEIGRVSRVVLDPKRYDVTHIIVHRDEPGNEDRAVPVDLIASADDDRITLRATVAQAESMPVFASARFVPVEDPTAKRDGWAPGVHWLPMWGAVPSVPDARPVVEKGAIPPGTVPLKAGAKVIAADGKVVGKVEGVLTDSQRDQATELVVARGGTTRKTVRRLPMRWVYSVKEGEVHLAVGSRTVQELKTHPR